MGGEVGGISSFGFWDPKASQRVGRLDRGRWGDVECCTVLNVVWRVSYGVFSERIAVGGMWYMKFDVAVSIFV